MTKNTSRKGYIYYKSFYEAIKNLSIEDRCKIRDAIDEFSFNNKEIELDGINEIIFTLIKPQLEANNARFRNGCKQKRSKKEAKKKQNESKTKAKEKEKEKEKDKEKVSKKNKSKKDFDFIAEENWKKLFLKWIDYRIEIKKPLKPVSYKAAFNKLQKLSKRNFEDANEIVGNSIANGWTGLFELKNKKKNKSLDQKNKEVLAKVLNLHEVINAG